MALDRQPHIGCAARRRMFIVGRAQPTPEARSALVGNHDERTTADFNVPRYEAVVVVAPKPEHREVAAHAQQFHLAGAEAGELLLHLPDAQERRRFHPSQRDEIWPRICTTEPMLRSGRKPRPE